MKKIAQAIMLLVVTLGLSVSVFGQSSTTAAFNGKVLDKQGAPLPGATVVAIHMPTNTQYGTITRDDGTFDLPGLMPGGPYNVKVSFVGYKGASQDSIYLHLGENVDLKFQMQEENVQMAEVRIVAKADNTFNAARTGAKTNVSREQINELPSISRSLQDYTRLTPQAVVVGGGISIAGSNNRYNNFQIDGTVNNDVFGLSSSGTNGGQASTQPISLDAIQELQVVIAPYDVRQGGFTGGAINAVTKSGTNSFTGTAYWFGNNQNLVGKTPTSDPAITRKKLNDYKDNQFGLSIGGPIIKDKLFFFANAELAKKDQPSTNNLGEGSNFSKDTLDAIVNRIAQIDPTYNTGGYDAYTSTTKSTKLFGRIDWNINAKNRLTIRHSYVDASSDILSRTANFFRFNNNGYTFLSKTNSSVMELNSRISNNLSNELRVGYTTVRDKRDIMGTPFPFIEIRNIDGISSQTIDLGTERYSNANLLNQNIFTLSDNFNYYYNFLGKHTFTAGTHNEFFNFKNLFIRDNTGAYIYSSLTKFLTDALPQEYSYSFSNPSTGSKQWAPTFSAYQLGFFVQDEWSLSNAFKLTYGVRIDVPVFPDHPSSNTAFAADPNYSKYGVATDKMPQAKVMWSPRVGFNWDVTGDRSTQLRGGAGIFTGRLPFVWLSNQFSNTGNEYARYDYKGGAANFPADFHLEPNVNQQWVFGSPLSSEIDVVDPHFKFPQSFRANLAVDQKLPYGIKGTLEGIYTKKMNDILYQDLTKTVTGTVAGIDNRPTYTKVAGTPYTNVIYLTNTNKGYSYSLTAMLNKDFNFGLTTMVAYTYGKSESVNDGTSSQAYSNWRYNYQYNGSNNPEMSFSAFDVRNRIVAAVTYKKEYLNKFATSVGLFYNGQTGANFSYVYNGDINGDGEYYNDLIFVPTDGQIDQMLTNGQFVTNSSNNTAPAAQAAALKSFLGSESYLKDRRGQYAQRNGATVPFVHELDLRVTQDFFLNVAGKKNTLQVTLDIFNLANFLNKDWGRVYSAGYSYSLMQYTGKQAVTNLPLYSFKPINGHAWQIDDFNSRWRAQLGLRYIFN
ncbi:MAG TPA: carboxypeptidase regulatory-like domain-containing protein [Williamwhitmania sp.]|nr:carboxypeptidase regulatory-like domain-containing protein [Williamwhitmania sp.]